jgi:hypothetical protein
MLGIDFRLILWYSSRVNRVAALFQPPLQACRNAISTFILIMA